jgi:hypothetical protein
MIAVRAAVLVLLVTLIALGPYTASRIYVAHHTTERSTTK